MFQITRVYRCDDCHYATAPYINFFPSLHVYLTHSFYYMSFQFIPSYYYAWKIEPQFIRLTHRLDHIIPASFGISMNPWFITSALAGLQLSMASTLFHGINGLTPSWNFSFDNLVRNRKMKPCARCGTVVAPYSKEEADRFEYNANGRIFCTENCKKVYLLEHTCALESCHKEIMQPMFFKQNKDGRLYFCTVEHNVQWNEEHRVNGLVQSSVIPRRTFTKRIGFGLVGIVAAAFLLGNFTGYKEAQATINPPASQTGVYGQYNTSVHSALVFVDSNGAGYVKSGNDGSILISNNTVTSAGNANGLGSIGATSTTVGIQEAFNFIGTQNATTFFPGTGLADGLTNPGGLIQMAAGLFTVTTAIRLPGVGNANPNLGTPAEGMTWTGCGFGDPSQQGGTIIQAGAGGMIGVVTFGNTSGNNVACRWAGSLITNMGFSANSHTFASNANSIHCVADFYNCNDGGTKGGTRFENLSFNSGGTTYGVDLSHNDDGIYDNLTFPSGGAGFYDNSGSGNGGYFNNCRLFAGGFFSTQQGTFHSCVWGHNLTIQPTSSIGQVNFTGSTYWNKGGSTTQMINTSNNVAHVQLSNTNWGISTLPPGSGVTQQGIWSNGNGTNGPFYIVSAVLNINNHVTSCQFFDHSDTVSQLFATMVQISAGGNMTYGVGGTGSPLGQGDHAIGIWTVYKNS